MKIEEILKKIKQDCEKAIKYAKNQEEPSNFAKGMATQAEEILKILKETKI